jgi:hypothetical protein
MVESLETEQGLNINVVITDNTISLLITTSYECWC